MSAYTPIHCLPHYPSNHQQWSCCCSSSILSHLVPDGISRPQANPLRDGSVLLLGSRELLLGAEGFVALPQRKLSISTWML